MHPRAGGGRSDDGESAEKSESHSVFHVPQIARPDHLRAGRVASGVETFRQTPGRTVDDAELASHRREARSCAALYLVVPRAVVGLVVRLGFRVASSVFLGTVPGTGARRSGSGQSGPQAHRRRPAHVSVLGARRRCRGTRVGRAVSSVRFEGRRARAHVAGVIAKTATAPTVVRISRTDVTGADR